MSTAPAFLVIFALLSITGGLSSRTAYLLREQEEHAAAATTLIAAALFFVGSALFALCYVLASKA